MDDNRVLQGGSVYGHLFENPAANVDRWVYWALSLETSGDEAMSMSIEWLRFDPALLPMRETIRCSAETQPDAEASVYVFSHEWVDSWLLEMSPLQDGRFRVALDATVPIEDEDGDVRDVVLMGETEVAFDGIILVKGNLVEKPGSDAAALELLAPFSDGRSFDVRDEDWRFVLTQR